MPEYDPADPNRCKQSVGDNQCLDMAAPGSEFCLKHRGIDHTNENSTRLYLLAKAEDRVRLHRLAEHDEIRSLREEIALARMLAERRWNMMKTDNDAIIHCASINTLLLTIERLVKSAHSIEQNLGILLSKSAVLNLGQAICRIIVDELEGIEDYEEIVDKITQRILTTIVAAKDNQPETIRTVEAKRLGD